MKIKLLFVAFFLMFASLAPASGQGRIKRMIADKEYKQFRFAEAAEHYGHILEKDSNNLEVKTLLAHCYRKMNDSREAEKWYFEVTNFEGEEAKGHQNIKYYAQMLSMNGDYEEAKIWYKIYSDMLNMHQDSLGHYYVKAYEHLDDFYRDSARYRIDTVNFNSEFSDFSPAYYKTGFVFASGRTPIRSKKHRYAWNNTAFLDLYHSPSRDSTVSLFNKKLTSRYHEGPLVFLAAEDSVIFTRNNYHKGKYRQSKDGTNKLKMYFAREKNEEWENITGFRYNSDEYSVGHPAITTDNTTLYFTSDMPGGMGGSDIWRCRLENGKWSRPENLGAPVNTSQNEMFPFLDEYNNLFFASNGHPGLGGLDIFLAKSAGNKYEKPQNIGFPINSSQDDFGLIMREAEQEGYFSSNREGGKGDDDIYKFRILPHRFCVLGYDRTTGETLTGITFDIRDKTSETAVLYQRESPKTVCLSSSPRIDYGFDLSLSGYENGELFLPQDSVSKIKSGDTVRIPMDPIPVVPEKTVPDTLETFIVYYDFDKSNIRPDAAATLNEVLDFMLVKHPKARILLSSHTDARATNDYNVRLSLRRSRSAFRYLADRGVAADRLKTVHHGEFKMAVPCPDGVDCSEPKHQLNRRTEIRVLEW